MQNNAYPELLPNLIRVPQSAQVQAQQKLDDIKDSAMWQAIQYGARAGMPYLPEGMGLLAVGRYGLNHPTIAPAVATLAATRLGRPFVNGVKAVADNPLTQKIDKAASKLIDLIL